MKLKASRVSVWAAAAWERHRELAGLPPVLAPRRAALRDIGIRPFTSGHAGGRGECVALLLPDLELSLSSLSREEKGPFS